LRDGTRYLLDPVQRSKLASSQSGLLGDKVCRPDANHNSHHESQLIINPKHQHQHHHHHHHHHQQQQQQQQQQQESNEWSKCLRSRAVAEGQARSRYAKRSRTPRAWGE
jgi:hypothetical protein